VDDSEAPLRSDRPLGGPTAPGHVFARRLNAKYGEHNVRLFGAAVAAVVVGACFVLALLG